MKRGIVLLLCICMAALLLCGCGQTGEMPSQERQPVQSSEEAGQKEDGALQEATVELPGGRVPLPYRSRLQKMGIFRLSI